MRAFDTQQIIESFEVGEHEASDDALATSLPLAVGAYTLASVAVFAVEATATIAIVIALLFVVSIVHS